jgi:ribosomal protein S2
VGPVRVFREKDIQKLVHAGVHMATHQSDNQMLEYVWRRRSNGESPARRDRSPAAGGTDAFHRCHAMSAGQYVLNLGRTWEKLILAARIIVAIESPQVGDVMPGRLMTPHST